MNSLASESKLLNDKLTVYDAFNKLKDLILDADLRHTLEGAVIVASPSILIAKKDIVSRWDVHDARYKLGIAQTVRDEIGRYSGESYSNNTSADLGAEIDRLLSLPVITNYVGYNQKGLNLPYVILKMHSDLTDEQISLACKRLGETTEKGLKSVYHNRGYKLNLNERPESVSAYLIAECEFFTRLTAEASNRSKKL